VSCGYARPDRRDRPTPCVEPPSAHRLALARIFAILFRHASALASLDSAPPLLRVSSCSFASGRTSPTRPDSLRRREARRSTAERVPQVVFTSGPRLTIEGPADGAEGKVGRHWLAPGSGAGRRHGRHEADVEARHQRREPAAWRRATTGFTSAIRACESPPCRLLSRQARTSRMAASATADSFDRIGCTLEHFIRMNKRSEC